MKNAIKNAFAVVRVVLARLRFVAVFAVAAVVVGQWDLIVNRIDQWTRPATAPDMLANASDVEYYCPMDGTVEDHPGPCPNCGMPLVKRAKGMAAMLPADVLARVQITPQRLALADVATTAAAFHTISRDIQAIGTIDYDQSRLFDLAARVGGRVDTLYITTIGQLIKPGDALYSLYSPDVYTALREYLQARKRETDMTKSQQPMPDEMNDAMSLRQAAERKLTLWGITMPQLEAIAADFDHTGNVPDHIDILATAGGVVTRKEIRQGGYLQPGDVPFTVADLSHVWMNAKIYESDIPLLHIGQDVAVTATAAPTQTFTGKVTFLAFQLDPATRTLDARIEIPNPDLTLRPEMFATAMIHTPAERSLTIPRSAVIDTGDRKIVYVRSSPGVFDMRAVAVAPPAGEEYAILSGLKEGESVVTRGAFLVDAEDRLNPAPTMAGQ